MKSKNKIKPPNQSVFQILAFRYLPYWPLFLLLTIGMAMAAWGYLQIASPVYQINAVILINDEKKGVEDPRMVESLSIYSSKKIVENEIEIIKSKKLMRETVEILGLCSPIFEREGFASIPAYTSCPVAVEVKHSDKLKEIPEAEFSYDHAKKSVTFNGQEYPLDEWILSPYGEIRFVKNKNLLKESGGSFYFSLIDPRKVTNKLVANLHVQPSNKLSTVVNLSINDIVPARGENILNTLIESYNRAVLDDKNKFAASTLKFLEERIQLVEYELDSLEGSIERYKSSRGIVDLSEQGKLFLKNVGENDQKLSELNMKMAALNRLEDYVTKKNTSSEIMAFTMGINDERLSLLVQKLHESEVTYAQLKNTTAENNPLLLSLQNTIKTLQPAILEDIRNQRSGVRASIADLTSTNSKYATVLETIPQQERELLEANRQQSIKNNVYTFLLQKKEETALSAASSVAFSRSVDRAESSLLPVSPKKPLIYASALALAFLISIACITVKEGLTSTILFRAEIESYTKIPISAEISYSGEREIQLFLIEQFRHLRTSLALHGTPAKKVILVTSSISGEGKSFICTNVAGALATSNKKAILIDMDLRNPRLSSIYKATNSPGITEYLNDNLPIEDIIRRTQLPNLFLIGAGKNRLNNAEVLLNGNLSSLFEKLRERFDYIIVDIAPIDPVSDAYLVSPYCDVTLFVVRHGKTPKTMVKLLDVNSKVKTLPNVSIVFNGIRPRGFIKNTYGYGYGYGYEYVYSYQKPEKKIEMLG